MVLETPQRAIQFHGPQKRANGYHITLHGSCVKILSCPKTMSQTLGFDLYSSMLQATQRLPGCYLPHVQEQASWVRIWIRICMLDYAIKVLKSLDTGAHRMMTSQKIRKARGVYETLSLRSRDGDIDNTAGSCASNVAAASHSKQ